LIIDVFSDTVCPWCRIGKRHLELALTEWAGESTGPVTVRYRSFFLDPTLPPEGRDFRAHMMAKGGGRVPLEQFFAAPRERGAAVGLTFAFEAIARAPNTLLSHQLVYCAPETQRGAVLDALYAAYFEFGRDIGDAATLAAIGAGAGLDETTLAAWSAGGGRAEVLADVDFARQVGISGVPFFIFNDKVAFSGAQPPEVVLRVLRQVAAESRMRGEG